MISRRKYLLCAAKVTTMILSASIFPQGCKRAAEETVQSKKDEAVSDCGDLSHVSQEQMAIREKLAYVRNSPMPDNRCDNCNLYLPPTGQKSCGGCVLFKGPVDAGGYCTYWAPRV